MTKEEKREFDELKALLKNFIDQKYDPDNGWKTNRALFEQAMVSSMRHIKEDLTELKKCTEPLPHLINSVNNIQDWRKKTNKVLIWIGTAIGTPILASIGYLIFKAIVR